MQDHKAHVVLRLDKEFWLYFTLNTEVRTIHRTILIVVLIIQLPLIMSVIKQTVILFSKWLFIFHLVSLLWNILVLIQWGNETAIFKKITFSVFFVINISFTGNFVGEIWSFFSNLKILFQSLHFNIFWDQGGCLRIILHWFCSSPFSGFLPLNSGRPGVPVPASSPPSGQTVVPAFAPWRWGSALWEKVGGTRLCASFLGS